MKNFRQMENDRDSLLAKKWRFLDTDSLDEEDNASNSVIINYDKTIRFKTADGEMIISFSLLKDIFKELLDIEDIINQDKLDKAYNEIYKLRKENE